MRAQAAKFEEELSEGKERERRQEAQLVEADRQIIELTEALGEGATLRQRLADSEAQVKALEAELESVKEQLATVGARVAQEQASIPCSLPSPSHCLPSHRLPSLSFTPPLLPLLHRSVGWPSASS